MSSIALRQHTINAGPFTFAHNFLVLCDDQGQVVAELHGLASDPASGDPLPVGRSSDYLRAYEFAGKRLWKDGQTEKVIWEGDPEAVFARWAAAKDAHDQINRRDLTYNLAGSDLNGPRDWDSPAPPVIAGNSNSVNRAFVESMGLRMLGMPTMAPGTENQLLPQNTIDQIRARYGFRLPPGGLF